MVERFLKLGVTGRGGFETRPYGVGIRGKGVKPLMACCCLQRTIDPEAGVLDIELPAPKGA